MSPKFYGMVDSAVATDKYTVVIETALPQFQPIRLLSWQHFIAPPETVDAKDKVDWKNNCGTGPYILADYVSGSSATAKRNPNYWGYDLLFPENKLPYVDEIVEPHRPEITYLHNPSSTTVPTHLNN
jgi:peptide/nickel transport system substrate-binding protein/nickel transport system substrate-binding protein